MSAWSFASQVYGSAWSTPAMRAIFDDAPRLRGWLEILATLADVQGESGLIPADAARDVASTCRAIEPNQDFLCGLEEDYRTSGHSTAGLIAAIASRCPGTSGQWVYYGVTVQDVADTWTMIALRDAGRLLRGDLTRVADAASAIAGTHRNTVMAGRTHGQQGLPITFGFKAAGWLVELRRHQERLGQVSKRMEIGQLCGGVGSLSSLGPNALEIQRKFCERLGLRTGAGLLRCHNQGPWQVQGGLRTKLILEVAGRTPEHHAVRVAEKEPRVPCTIGEKIWQDRWGR